MAVAESSLGKVQYNYSVILIGAHVNILAIRLAEAIDCEFLESLPGDGFESNGQRKICILRPGEKPASRKFFLEKWMQNGDFVIQVLSSLDDPANDFREVEECSNYTYFFDGNIESQIDQELGIEGLLHLINYADGKLFEKAVPTLKFRSFFLSLILGDVSPIIGDLQTMMSGTHAVELRIDIMLDSAKDSRTIEEFRRYISQQVSRVRTGIKNHPIIFTIRSSGEGGRFCSSKFSESELLNLFNYALRLGCEFIDLEMNLNPSIVKEVTLAASMKSRIIASYHSTVEPLDWTGKAGEQAAAAGRQFGDVIKIVSIANSDDDNVKVQKFTDDYYSQAVKIPLIAFNMGKLGRMSRVRNRFFTPVTHEALPGSAKDPAIYQVTCKEIWKTLQEEKLVTPKRFYIFGEKINYSLSPLIHNTNFDYFNLPFTYSIMDTKDISEIENVMRAADFGGASVTIPHKQAVIPLLGLLSPVAEKIGAVNTIVVKPDGQLHGENTDYLGIQYCLQRKLKMSARKRSNCSAMLIGSGGTARAALYVLYGFGFKCLYLYNRTESKLKELTKGYTEDGSPTTLKVYNGSVESLLNGESPVVVIVDTTPGTSGMCTNEFVNQVFRDESHSAVLVKLAYGNMATEEQELKPWISLITGLDILIEQAIWAAMLWTGLMPDTEYIQNAVNQKSLNPPPVSKP